MPNMRMDKNPMPEQCPNVRNKNFLEVTTGYTEEMAIDEAQRCLNCKHKPCMQGCPVSVKIPEFIAFVAKGEFENAYKKIKETNALPAVRAGSALWRQNTVTCFLTFLHASHQWKCLVR